MINKIFIFLAVLGSSMDEKGWVSVERPRQAASQQAASSVSEEEWPVFIRQFGSDRVVIRFPGEPSYEYPNVEAGDLETVWVVSQSGRGVHTLFVELKTLDFSHFIEKRKSLIESEEGAFLVSADPKGEGAFDFLYRKDEKWVRERLFATSDRFYILQSASDTLNEEFHLRFLASFDVENRDQKQVFHREIQSEN